MYKNILIAIDLNHLEEAKMVVKNALNLGGNNPDVVYRVVSIIEPVDNSLIAAFLPQNFDKSVLVEANNALHRFTQTAFPEHAKVQHNVAYGTVYEEINRIAKEKSVDIILMLASSKTKARGLSSNTRRVIKYSDVPVLVLR